MLLAGNIANAKISFGFFDEQNGELGVKFQIAADLHKTSDEYKCTICSLMREFGLGTDDISAIILSSVVPQLTAVINTALSKMTGLSPMMVGPGLKTGFSIKIDSPSELGGDMVANTAAVLASFHQEGRAAIIADLGTVTTISAITRFREYVGCCIIPGIGISFDGLHGRTAQLPNVMQTVPSRYIGRNSQESVCSGVLYGHAMMIDGFVTRFSRELKCSSDDICLVMTGEYSESIAKLCGHSFKVEPDLTLKGLFVLYRNSTRTPESVR